ncbi:hypothetical protein BC936DRAFT_145745 [Jimgerdemannia flammicorona]|uniref:GATA-type domain-containing protein n=1 Tax=Jimgerdemannia flammicorona TaxID=994334 RepID=A0A433D987_9FUNG|nr:hypothetical protein BC936DRAFT_145745 [Jimgerdemannia flammicorona]
MTEHACFWALLSFGDLKFAYLPYSSLVQQQRLDPRVVDLLLGKSFFDFVHHDEVAMAKEDLNKFMQLKTLYGSVTSLHIPRGEATPGGVRLVSSLNARVYTQNSERGWKSSKPRDAGLDEYTTCIDILPYGLSCHRSKRSHIFFNATLENDGSASVNEHSFEEKILRRCRFRKLRELYRDSMLPSPSIDRVIKDEHNLTQSEKQAISALMEGPSKPELHNSSNILDSEYVVVDVVMNVEPSAIAQHLRRAFLDSSPDINRLVERFTSNIPHPTMNHPVRIFQVLDSLTRRLLFTWPDPYFSESDGYRKDGSWPVKQEGYRPEDFARLVQINSPNLSPTSSSSSPSSAYHIPGSTAGASCTQRRNLQKSLPQPHGPPHKVEGVMIPYGVITFASFQVSAGSSQRPSSMSGPQLGGRQSSSPPVVSMAIPGLTGQDVRGSYPAPHFYQHQRSTEELRSSGTYGASNGHQSMDEMTPASSPVSSPNLQRVNRNHHNGFSYHSAYTQTLPPEAQYQPSYPLHSQRYSAPIPYDDQTPANPRGIPHARRASPPQPLSTHQQQSPVSSSFHESQLVSTTNPAIPYARRGSPPPGHLFSLPPTPAYPPYEDPHVPPPSRTPGIPYARHASPLPTQPPPVQQSFPLTSQPVPYQFGSNGQVSHRVYTPPSPRETDRSPGNGGAGPKKYCESCGTDSSPEWRRGPTGHKTLCNACGLRYSRSIARQGKAAQHQQMRGSQSRAILAPGSGNSMISNADTYPSYPHHDPGYGSMPPSTNYSRQPSQPPMVSPTAPTSAHRYHPYSGPGGPHNSHPPPPRSSASTSPMSLPLPLPQIPGRWAWPSAADHHHTSPPPLSFGAADPFAEFAGPRGGDDSAAAATGRVGARKGTGERFVRTVSKEEREVIGRGVLRVEKVG